LQKKQIVLELFMLVVKHHGSQTQKNKPLPEKIRYSPAPTTPWVFTALS
jgi:hypothetical protein